MSSNSRCQRRVDRLGAKNAKTIESSEFVRFADGPFVNRIERWLALVHAHLCGLMTIFTIAGGQWPNHPAGLSGAAKH